MGRRGPPPTPKSVLENRGSWRAETKKEYPKRKGESTIPIRTPPPPPAILDEIAADRWVIIADDLAKRGMLEKVDHDALLRLCMLWSRWCKNAKFLQENGDVWIQYEKWPPLPRGKAARQAEEARRLIEKPPVKNIPIFPQVKIIEKLETQIVKLEIEFGLTPAARARFESSGGGKGASSGGDELDAILKMRG